MDEEIETLQNKRFNKLFAKIQELQKNNDKLKTKNAYLKQKEEISENRGKFIDWMIDNHLDIVKDYLGFNE